MDAAFCVEAREEVLSRNDKPEIFNIDQASQFTRDAFTSVLRAAKVRISMDGSGRWTDHVFIERLWPSVKHECVYLHAFETGSEPRARWSAGSPTTTTIAAFSPCRPPAEAYEQIGYSGMGGMPHDPRNKLTA